MVTNAVDILATLRKELSSKNVFANRSLTNHKTRVRPQPLFFQLNFLSLRIPRYIFPFPSLNCDSILFSQSSLTMLPISLLVIGNTASSQKSLVSSPEIWLRKSFSFPFCAGVQEDPQFLLSGAINSLLLLFDLSSHLSKKKKLIKPHKSAKKFSLFFWIIINPWSRLNDLFGALTLLTDKCVVKKTGTSLKVKYFNLIL